MEIVSPPAVIVETVTDLDVGFSDTDVKQYTLTALDEMRETDKTRCSSRRWAAW